MQTLIYSFEELPLVIYNGIEAAFINGQAEVLYQSASDWHLGDISVEGFGERDGYGKRSWPQVPAPLAMGRPGSERRQRSCCGGS